MQENQNPVRPVKDVIPLSAHSQLLDQLREGHAEEQQNLRAALEAANARNEVKLANLADAYHHR